MQNKSNEMETNENNRLIAENYLIDRDGSVYSVRSGRERILKIGTSGYMQLVVTINKKQYTRLLHRLIAETWIPNPENLPEVNHIDGNKLNNDISNLEWVSRSQNVRHAVKNGLMPAPWSGKKGKHHHRSKPVFKCDACGFPISRFDGIREAERQTGIDNRLIGDVLSGRLKSAGGFLWRYA